jgi:hypothetical protein
MAISVRGSFVKKGIIWGEAFEEAAAIPQSHRRMDNNYAAVAL